MTCRDLAPPSGPWSRCTARRSSRPAAPDGMFAVQGLISVFKVLLAALALRRLPRRAGDRRRLGGQLRHRRGRGRVLAAAADRASYHRGRGDRASNSGSARGPRGTRGCQETRRLYVAPRRPAPHQRRRAADTAAAAGPRWWRGSARDSNAYFYITWMIGSVFFMVSPSISQALFAESVRYDTGLRPTVVKAFRIASLLLIPAMVAMVAGGKLILAIFGQDVRQRRLRAACPARHFRDARRGVQCRGRDLPGDEPAWLLRLDQPRDPGHHGGQRLAADAEVRDRRGRGICWLAAQVLGAIASVPALLNLASRTWK